MTLTLVETILLAGCLAMFGAILARTGRATSLAKMLALVRHMRREVAALRLAL